MNLKTARCQPRTGTHQATILAGILSFLIFHILIKESSFLNSSLSQQSNLEKNSEINWLDPIDNFKTEELKYAQAAEGVPLNTPDNTKLFSFRDQQAAQPKEALESSRSLAPSSTTQNQIIGISKRPDLLQNVPSNDSEFSDSLNQDLAKIFPIKKDLLVSNKGNKGEGVESATRGKPNHILDLRGNQPEQTIQTHKFNEKIESLTKVKNRPKLSTELISSTKMSHNQNARRKGKLAIECRLHPFGIYVQKMLKSIEQQWLLLLSSSYVHIRKMPTPQTFVYRFKLNSSGKIIDLELDSHPFDHLLAAELCRQAIASRAPFGKWTKEMIQDFGHNDQVTIKFEYL